MNRHYDGLIFKREQPESRAENDLTRMAIGDPFRFVFLVGDKVTRDEIDLEIRSTRFVPERNVIVLEVRTLQGEIPLHGVQHGTFTLEFNAEWIDCRSLPPEMFEEGG